jgi:hypothetical protein
MRLANFKVLSTTGDRISSTFRTVEQNIQLKYLGAARFLIQILTLWSIYTCYMLMFSTSHLTMDVSCEGFGLDTDFGA